MDFIALICCKLSYFTMFKFIDERKRLKCKYYKVCQHITAIKTDTLNVLFRLSIMKVASSNITCIFFKLI